MIGCFFLIISQLYGSFTHRLIILVDFQINIVALCHSFQSDTTIYFKLISLKKESTMDSFRGAIAKKARYKSVILTPLYNGTVSTILNRFESILDYRTSNSNFFMKFVSAITPSRGIALYRLARIPPTDRCPAR